MKGPTKDCPACHQENPDGAEVCQNEACLYEFDSDIGSEGTKLANAEITGFSEGDLIAGRYRVVRELGRGGMGVVYLAADIEVDDDMVALKMIHPNLLANHEARQRFVNEALISRKLEHHNIIRVHDLKRWEGLRYISMEYIDGLSLREWMNRRKGEKPPFTLPEVFSVIDPLLEALSYAHRFTTRGGGKTENVVHRDVKPENIMVIGEFPEVQIKVLDFGIARTLSPSRFSYTAHALGTAYYMAPEQRKGEKDIDHRSDLYSVGIIFYEMLIGEIPDIFPELPSRVNPELPGEIDEIVTRLLKSLPEDRYADAEGVRIALSGAVSAYETHRERRQEEEERRLQAEIADLLDKGQSLIEACKWPEAEGVFTRVLELDPEHEQAGLLLNEVREKEAKLRNLLKETESAESQGDLEHAISLFNQVISLSADQDTVKERKAGLQIKMAEKLQKAAERERKEREERELEQKRKDEAERQKAEAEKRKAEEQERAEEEERKRAEQEPIETERRKEEERKVKEERRRAEAEREEAFKRKQQREENRQKKRKVISLIVALCVLALIGMLVYQGQNGKIEEKAGAPPVVTKGRLFVDAEPEGCEIRLLNKQASYRSGMELEQGRYHIEVSHAGYITSKERVDLTAGEDNTFSFKLNPVVTTGTVLIQTNPAGAKWYLDGSYQGTSPGESGNVSEGTYQIRIAHPGHKEWNGSVKVKAGQSVTVRGDLVSLKGKLYVSAEPEGAEIRLLDTNASYGPGIELEKGLYQVEVYLSGYETKRGTCNARCR